MGKKIDWHEWIQDDNNQKEKYIWTVNYLNKKGLHHTHNYTIDHLAEHLEQLSRSAENSLILIKMRGAWNVKTSRLKAATEGKRSYSFCMSTETETKIKELSFNNENLSITVERLILKCDKIKSEIRENEKNKLEKKLKKQAEKNPVEQTTLSSKLSIQQHTIARLKEQSESLLSELAPYKFLAEKNGLTLSMITSDDRQKIHEFIKTQTAAIGNITGLDKITSKNPFKREPPKD
jgi:hypothetical protein